MPKLKKSTLYSSLCFFPHSCSSVDMFFSKFFFQIHSLLINPVFISGCVSEIYKTRLNVSACYIHLYFQIFRYWFWAKNFFMFKLISLLLFCILVLIFIFKSLTRIMSWLKYLKYVILLNKYLIIFINCLCWYSFSNCDLLSYALLFYYRYTIRIFLLTLLDPYISLQSLPGYFPITLSHSHWRKGVPINYLVLFL